MTSANDAIGRCCSVCGRPLREAGTRHRTCLPSRPPRATTFTTFDTRLAAYAVIPDEDGRVLLTSSATRSGVPQWSLPGGEVEFAEEPTSALAREIVEETGYAAAIGEIIGVNTDQIEAHRRHSHQQRPLKTVQLLYLASTPTLLGEPEEGATAAWVPLADVAGLRRRSSVDIALGFARAMGHLPAARPRPIAA